MKIMNIGNYPAGKTNQSTPAFKSSIQVYATNIAEEPQVRPFMEMLGDALFKVGCDTLTLFQFSKGSSGLQLPDSPENSKLVVALRSVIKDKFIEKGIAAEVLACE